MRAKGLKQERSKPRPDRPCSGTPRTFLRDFAPLEAALARSTPNRGTVMTPERMIVELHLTPPLVRRIEQRYRILFPWFATAYAILKRHDLLPATRTPWKDWLKRYRRRRTAARCDG